MTIVALTPAIVPDLAKQDLAPILEARPQIAQELSRARAQRQAAGRVIASAKPGKTEPTRNLSDWFFERMRKLFDLSSGQ